MVALPTFDFEHVSEARNRPIWHLFRQLAEHEPFMDRVEELRSMFRATLAKNAWSELQDLGQLASPIRADEVLAQRYLGELRRLVSDYGLNEQWAAERIDYAIRAADVMTLQYRLLYGLQQAGEADSPCEEYTITWNPWSAPTKKTIRDHVLSQFEVQWQQYQQMMEADGFKKVRRRSSFEDHMRWVFQRVCLKQSWNQIATSTICSPDTVRSAVEPIIEALGLQRPNLKGGRPPRKPS